MVVRLAQSIAQRSECFNAGSLTDSIVMATADYLAVAKPAVFAFSITSRPE